VQADFTPQRVSTELRRLIPDGEARTTMIQDFQEVRQRLAANDSGGSASDRAARAVLSIVGKCQ
jgi:lipid A disaccharide synthetase